MTSVFKDVDPEFGFVKMEEDILSFWDDQDIFHRSLSARSEGERFVFFEGPPTANGLPGSHHVLARVFKDIICRYKSMQGYYVERKAGWDCHGLPVELEVEKKLGISSKPQIEAFGIDKFNQECRTSVLRYTKEWEDLTRRIAFWVDIDRAYVTMTDDYIETLWWALKQLWEKDLLYEGHKVVPYCPRCGSSLSSHEVAQGYQTVKDPSIYVRFRSVDEPELSFLVWTTTPWTLAGNVALAVNPHLDYVRARTSSGEEMIVAEALAAEALAEEGEAGAAGGDTGAAGAKAGGGVGSPDVTAAGGAAAYEVVERPKGSDLVALRYTPILEYCVADGDAYRIVPGDFVTTDDGTGIVHIAPAYGEDDMKVSREHGLSVLEPVDLEGKYRPEVTPWAGVFVKDADPLIIERLRADGKLHKALEYEHTYPFCWRCDTPLLYYAKVSWFIKTTAVRDRLVELNKTINWVPEHLRDGRFGQWLENLVDWALSRERYWGTPLPIWRCPDCGELDCVGSIDEMKEKAVKLPERIELHRPYVDEVVLECSKCGGAMNRVTEVIDAWFDSGAMPYAQWHYPFGGDAEFEASFPADYISEGIDQTRGWFFSLHALSTMLFDRVAYKNVISLGHILDENGEKMSKHRGNVVEPWPVINKYGADAFRWYLYTMSPAGSPKKFALEGLEEVLRKFFLTLWNTYSFFVTYSNIDGFDPRSASIAPAERPIIDRWLAAAREDMVASVTTDLDAYNVTGAGRRIGEFVDDLSNWYVRRCRRRFWKSEEDTDKMSAYLTLHETLVTVAKLLAPLAPFMSEAIYRNLVAGVDPDAPPSVHMADFPAADVSLMDEQLKEEMDGVRQIVSLARAARARSRIKVRQPLSQLWVTVSSAAARGGLERLRDQILEEVNVKAVSEMTDGVEAFMGLSVKPNLHTLGPKLGAKTPALRSLLESSDPFAVRRAVVDDGGTYRVEIEDEVIELGADDLLFEETSREEFVVEANGGVFVALSVEVTPELQQEGLAREIVHFIQNVRKEAGFRIEDKIVMGVDHADTELAEVLEGFQSYILGETLTEEIVDSEDIDGGYVGERELDGFSLRVTLAKR